MNQNTLHEIAAWLIPLVIAIVFHEVAHGLVARRLGDPTAAQLGRLTLNPLKHIDPLGTVVLPLLLAVSHAGAIFGWAKPVPVNYAKLRNPRRDMVLVALAGPGMNFLLALVGAAILGLTMSVAGDPPSNAALLVAKNAFNFIGINIFLGVFNLLPVPPFDGGHVLEGLLPPPLAKGFRKLGRYSLLVLVVLLLVLPAIGVNIVGGLVWPVVDWVANLFLGIFGVHA
jgi:Zn-dependent protease